MKKLFLSLVCLLSLNANQIKLMTEIFPPYQFKNADGKLVGISVEIVKAIQKELNDNSKIKVYPWNRGVKILEHKKNSALFSMMRTPKRENRYKWVGPLASLKLVFFKREDFILKLNSIDDAKKVKKIGVTKEMPNYQILKSLKFNNLDVLNSNDTANIKKLVKKRINLWLSVRAAGIYSSIKMGYKDIIVPIDNIVLAKGDLYIAFNKQTDDEVINKWQKALDKLKQNGIIKKIIYKYIGKR